MAVERNFYVSWLADANDPWPGWRFEAKVDSASFSADDPAWPGIPQQRVDKTTVAAPGPTLTALFHPRSRFVNLESLDKIYLLYQEKNGSSKPTAEKAISRIIDARNLAGAKIDPGKIEFVEIKGIIDPTNHEQVIESIEKWINESKHHPFGATRRAKPNEEPTRITINLSPGTPAMHASWMLMYWKGSFRFPIESAVHFVQGDGGRREGDGVEESTRKPIRDVPVSRLTNLIDIRSEVQAPDGDLPPPFLQLDQLTNPLYQELGERIEKAALLGIPVVLKGERGTGKTMLAKHYHQRRLNYQQTGSQPDQGTAKSRGRRKGDEPARELVSVTLSEYSNVEELRDQLFGWAKGSFTGATEDYAGLLGQADGGTLFLDEIHHLEKPLQAALLRPMNDGRYRPKGSKTDQTSHFNLVVATNDDSWGEKLAEDFRDRIERIVLELPSFSALRKKDPTCEDLLRFWDHTIRRRCQQSGVRFDPPSPECQQVISSTLEHKDMKGNWRDLHRMADHVLLDLVQPLGGHVSPIQWDVDRLKSAINKSFDQ